MDVAIFFYGLGVVGLFVTTIYFLVRSLRFYRLFRNRLKDYHYDAWRELMNRDPVIREIGDWARWPTDSVQVTISVFDLKKSYGDELILAYKRGFVRSLASSASTCLFLVALIVATSRATR